MKLGTTLSELQNIYEGDWRGLIIGPVLFNFFIYDIFHLTNNNTLYNNADEKTLSYAQQNIDMVIQNRESDNLELIKKTNDKNISFHMAGSTCKVKA